MGSSGKVLTSGEVIGAIPSGTYADEASTSASLATKLAKASNLSDLTNAATATANLHQGVPYIDARSPAAGMVDDGVTDNAPRVAPASALGDELRFTGSGDYAFGTSYLGASFSVPDLAPALLLSNGSSVDQASYVTTSFATQADRLNLLLIASTAAADPPVPTVTDGAGRTWTLIDSDVSGTIRESVYRTTSAGTGTVTIDFGGATQTGCRWQVTAIAGADMSGANGAGAIGKVSKSTTTASGVPKVRAPMRITRLGSGVFYGVALLRNEDIVPGFGLAEVSDVGHANPASRLGSFFARAVTVPTASWSTVGASVGIALEIRAALTVVPGTKARNLTFQPGRRIKPLAGQTVVVAGRIPDSIDYQIFDLSAGGRVTLSAASLTSTVRPEWWGAVGDGVDQASDSPAIRAACQALRDRGGGTALFRDGSTYVVDVTNDPDTNTFHLDATVNGAVIDLPASSTIWAKGTDSSNGGFYQVVNLQGCRNVRLTGGGLVRGDLKAENGIAGHAGLGTGVSGDQYGHCVRMLGVSKVVSDWHASYAWGDGYYIADDAGTLSEDVTLRGVTIDDCRREGLGPFHFRKLRLYDVTIKNTGVTAHAQGRWTAPGSGLDIEPNDDELAEDLYAVNLVIDNCQGRGINQGLEGGTIGAKAFTFVNTIVTNCGWGGGGNDDGAKFTSVDTFRWVGGLIEDNAQRGMVLVGSIVGKVIGATIRNNGLDGVITRSTAATTSLQLVSPTVTGNGARALDLGGMVAGCEVTVSDPTISGNAHDASIAASERVDIRMGGTGTVRLAGGTIGSGSSGSTYTLKKDATTTLYSDGVDYANPGSSGVISDANQTLTFANGNKGWQGLLVGTTGRIVTATALPEGSLTALPNTLALVRPADSAASLWLKKVGIDAYGWAQVQTGLLVPVAVNLTAAGTGADTSVPINTAVVTPIGHRLSLIAVESTAATTPNVPTVSAPGETWEVVDTVLGPTGTRRLTVLRSMTDAPVSLARSIAFGGQLQTAIGWSIDQFANLRPGANGANAIGDTSVDNGSAVTSLPVTLAPTVGTVTYGAFHFAANEDCIPGPGFMQLGDAGHTAPVGRIFTEWKAEQDATVDASWTSPANAVGIALELILAS